MEENNFDKQVRDELEKFRLRPSAPVWEKIEEELGEKKRRRVILFIFLLAGLSLLGYSGYTLLGKSKTIDASGISQNNKQGNSVANKQKDKLNDNSSLPVQPLSSKDKDEVSTKSVQSSKHSPIASTSKEISKELAEKNLATTTQAIVNSNVSNKQDLEKNKKTIVYAKPGIAGPLVDKADNSSIKVNKKSPELIASSEKLTSVELPIDRANDAAADPSVPIESTTRSATGIENKNSLVIDNPKKSVGINLPIAKTNDSTENGSLTVQSLSPLPQNDTMNSAVASTAVSKINKNKQQGKRSKRIQWLADISGGVSGIIVRTSNQSAAPISFGGVLAPGLTSNVTGNSAAYNYPSPIKPNIAFHVGVIASKNIAKKIAISSGLKYAYYSTTIKAGNLSYSAIAFDLTSPAIAYRSVVTGYQQKSYSNQYHFLQVPISIEYKLNKSKKLPINWLVGGSFSYLIAQKNLVYSEALGGIYYKDNDALNKTHMELNTGFLFTISRKLGLSVGPEALIDMRPLIKEAYGNKQQIIYGGITARMKLK